MVGVPWLVGFYTDWLWFGETGYQAVFLRSLSAQGTLGLTVMALALAWLLLNLRPALQRITRRAWVVTTPEGPRSVAVEAGSMRLIGYALAVVAAGLVATVAATQWESWLFFRHATAFGVRDPILGRDVGFYVFKLPFLQLVQGLMMTSVVMAAIGAAAAYAVTGMLGMGGRGPFLRGTVQTHFALLAAAFFAVLAFGAWLRIPALLIQSSGILHGASYADVHARLPALRVLVVAAVAAAVLSVVAALRGRLRLLVGAAALYGARAPRRRGLRVAPAALRGRAQRAGQGDAVPAAQHRGARGRPSRSRTSPSASSPATAS